MQSVIQFIKDPLVIQYILVAINLIAAILVIGAGLYVRKALKNIVKVTDLQLKASVQLENTFTSMMDAMVKMSELRKELMPTPKPFIDKVKQISDGRSKK
jgi:hypothetical protein